MSRAISAGLLCSTATAYRVTGTDADRNPVYSGGTELSGVWVMRTIAQAKGAYGAEGAGTMTLYFDCVRSSPEGWVPEKNMRIDYAGESYTVQQVTPCMTPGGLHHYEAVLK